MTFSVDVASTRFQSCFSSWCSGLLITGAVLLFKEREGKYPRRWTGGRVNLHGAAGKIGLLHEIRIMLLRWISRTEISQFCPRIPCDVVLYTNISTSYALEDQVCHTRTTLQDPLFIHLNFVSWPSIWLKHSSFHLLPVSYCVEFIYA